MGRTEKSTTLHSVFAALLLCLAFPLMAQQEPAPSAGAAQTENADQDDWQRGFKLGGIDLIFTAGLSLGYDTNVTLSNTDTIESVFYGGTVAVRLEKPTRKSLTDLTCDRESRWFVDSPIDDYTNYGCRLQYRYDPTHRVMIDLFAGVRQGVDRRGTGRRQGDSGLEEVEPDEARTYDIGGKWTYGGKDARGRIVLAASAYDIDYLNNLEETAALDREGRSFGGSFHWRLSQKTSAIFSCSWLAIDYDQATLDSEEKFCMAGVGWRMTAKTSGEIQFGKLKKDFDDPTRRSYDDVTWDGRVDWSHRPHSIFTLRSFRRTAESYGYSDYIVRSETVLSWDYTWKWGFRTKFNVMLASDDHEDLRRDSMVTWGIARSWSLGHYTSLGASLSYERRDSNIKQFTYNQAILMVTLQGKF